mgnify:CR=1 FL=1
MIGLIPARAGKTHPRSRYQKRYRAHPRSRGENVRDIHPHQDGPGSSPLARGKHKLTTSRQQPTRLIPARAGKTPCPALGNTRLAAHPRSRGENSMAHSLQSVNSGSSPLARGKLLDPAIPDAVARLIPARAGKTPSADHRTARDDGSSPLARGKHKCPLDASQT